MNASLSIFQMIVRPLRGVSLAGLLACGLTGAMHAQSAVLPQIDFPQHPHQNEWYFNQVAHKVWYYRNDAWQPFPCKDCRSVKLCNEHVIVKNGFDYMLATQSGRMVVAKSPNIRCMDAFIVVGSADSRIDYLLNTDSDTVSALVNNCKIYSDTLEGDIVYCFPRYSPGLEKFNCAHLRNWGMMDAQGKWRIDPCYDKPFHFQSGRAHVWYKGIPGSIDETGKFLPDPPEDPVLFPEPVEKSQDE